MKRTLKKVKHKLRAYCNPKKNLTYERNVFNSRSQEDCKSINAYVTELLLLILNLQILKTVLLKIGLCLELEIVH